MAALDLTTLQFNEIFARSMQISAAEVTDDMSPETVPSWDSFNSLLLISELEKGFKMRFLMEDVRAIKKVRDIKVMLRKKGIPL